MLGYQVIGQPQGIKQCEIRHRHHPLARIAVYTAEGSHLTHIHVVKACQFIQHTLRRSVNTFVGSHKSAHKRPFTLLRLEGTASEQYAQLAILQAEDDTVHTYIEAAMRSVI